MAASVAVQVEDSELLPMAQINNNRFGCHRYTFMVVFCVLLTVSGVLYLGYFCPETVCALSNKSAVEKPFTLAFAQLKKLSSLTGTNEKLSNENMGRSAPLLSNHISFNEVSKDDFDFDIKGRGVVVFLHIQKTGGTTFGKHLVHDLDLERPCVCQRRKKRCECFRPNKNENWLFSRYSTGWKCGLHADWTELTSCVDEELDRVEGESVKRRYFYITLLRDPVSRYLSEFRHVQRGATWKNARHFCGGREATESEVPQCYNGDSWEGVTLEEFMNCHSNLASNRQTRMLADLTLVDCYNTSSMSESDRNKIMLISAKKNLAAMSFFGLTEYQRKSQYIFEQTFNLHFKVPFDQYNSSYSGHTRSELTKEQIEHIRKLNLLDTELYKYAENLLNERFKSLRDRDANFTLHFEHLGENPIRSSFNWEDIEKED